MFSTSGSSTSGCRRPRPNSAAMTAVAIPISVSTGHGACPAPTRARARVGAGQAPWPVETEMGIATAVMAALFGLGRLQPLVDDPDVENIEVDGHDSVWISYADAVSYTHLTLPTKRIV